jgi:hypothetical protein
MFTHQQIQENTALDPRTLYMHSGPRYILNHIQSFTATFHR